MHGFDVIGIVSPNCGFSPSRWMSARWAKQDMRFRMLGMRFWGVAVAAGCLHGVAAYGSTARYDVVFHSTWSEATHPSAWPDGAHFSRLIGGTHDGSASFWRAGGLASPGIEAMAERGSTTPLQSEVQTQIAAGHAYSVINGGGLFPSPGFASATFDADSRFPLATLVSMVAPSPDWFVGVDGLNLMENGAWRERVTVDLAPFDAGTDDGATFSAADIESAPHKPISMLGSPFSAGTSLGTFEFHLVSSVVPEPSTAALFAMGMAAMGLSRRRRSMPPARASG